MSNITHRNLLEKIITTILVLAFASFGLPLVGLYLDNMTGELSGWALIGLFAATGIVGLLIMVGIFFGLYRMWSGGR